MATHGDGYFDRVQTFDILANGKSQEVTTQYSPDGNHVVSKTVATTEVSGLSQTTLIDADGDGINEKVHERTTVVDANGVSTVTERLVHGQAALHGERTVTTTSATACPSPWTISRIWCWMAA